MKPDLCKWLVLLVLASTGSGAQDDLPIVYIEPANDLRADGRAAGHDCIPVLLEFSARGCGYCELLEEEILKPILRNRSYDSRVRIRKVHLDSYQAIQSFDGATTNGARLAQHYRVFVTPTLLFLDPQGNELAERMVGVTTLEFYGGYLDQALDESGKKLCSKSASGNPGVE